MFGHDDKDKNEENKAEFENAADGNHDENQQDDNQHDQNWQHPGNPIDDHGSSDDNQSDNDDGHDGSTVTPSEDKPEDGSSEGEHSNEEPEATTINLSETSSPSDNSANGLIDIKQEALTKLNPLIDHLDQSPEEKFRTLMMMIQASDDQNMIRQAYDTALEISDEKERAQALLDIVNEINYFTQNSKPE